MEELAKLVIGLLFIAIFIRMMKEGPGGVRAWYRAKFLGQVA